MKTIINAKGLTLVELLLSIAISGIILFTIMQNFTVNQKSAKNIASIYELINIQRNIRKTLANPNSCKETLEGYDVNNTSYGVAASNITQIISKEDTVSPNITLYTSNTNMASAIAYGNKLIKIRGFRLDSSQTGLGAISTNSLGYTDLVVQFFLAGNSVISSVKKMDYLGIILSNVYFILSLPKAFARSPRPRPRPRPLPAAQFLKERRIRLEATTNASGQIVNCSVDGVWSVNNKEMAQAFCQNSLGGSFDNSGRGGLGECSDLSIEGSITALNTVPSSGRAVGIEEFEEIAEYICFTLGGSFFALATGVAGVGECKNLKPHGDLIINSSNTATKLILEGGDIFMY